MMKLVQVLDGSYQTIDGTLLSLAEIDSRFAEQILASTLVRRIEKQTWMSMPPIGRRTSASAARPAPR
jgi:hypothetical protein